MPEVMERGALGRPAQVAIGFAIVALLTSLVAVVVVLRRGPEVAPAAAKPAPSERTVDASEVARLKRDVVAKATDDRGEVIGVRVEDAALRGALGLEATDVITAINGRAIEREFDVYDAVLGMSMMDASIIYIELVRAGAPELVRWKLDGNLRGRDRPDRSSRRPRLGTGGVARGSVPGPSTSPPDIYSMPRPSTAPDPLVDTIRKRDDLHYEVPRSTIERLLANPDAFARQARIVPSIRNGQPDGFRLYAIRAGSLWAGIGLHNGDTIKSVNGHELSSPDKALELYTKIRDATELRVLVARRGGSEETLVITIQ